jgi:hypothetical protein
MLTAKPRPKRCRHCKAQFAPARPLQTACGLACAAAMAISKREKEYAKQARIERAADRAKLEAMKGIPRLIADVQKVFNSYIRERDKDKGCFVCGRPFENVQGKALQAGHVRSRGAAGHLRFVEDNCMGECEGCNGPHGAKPHQIEAGAIARIGQERFDALKNDNTPHKFTRDELRQIKTTYAAKLRELKETA